MNIFGITKNYASGMYVNKVNYNGAPKFISENYTCSKYQKCGSQKKVLPSSPIIFYIIEDLLHDEESEMYHHRK